MCSADNPVGDLDPRYYVKMCACVCSCRLLSLSIIYSGIGLGTVVAFEAGRKIRKGRKKQEDVVSFINLHMFRFGVGGFFYEWKRGRHGRGSKEAAIRIFWRLRGELYRVWRIFRLGLLGSVFFYFGGTVSSFCQQKIVGKIKSSPLRLGIRKFVTLLGNWVKKELYWFCKFSRHLFLIMLASC